MKNVDVVIVGGGPTGLFLASLLLQSGIKCSVLEQRPKPTTHSRSIGVHPPSLERLASIGVAEHILKAGVIIRNGLAFIDGRPVGALTFDRCPGPYPFVVSLPQFQTEAILENRLDELDPHALWRDTRVTHIEGDENGVAVRALQGDQEVEIRAKFVVGCDGRNSTVRELSGLSFPGKDYDDTYMMGDFQDSTDFGPDAAIFLGKAGVVECFPLPAGLRRWVAKTDGLISDPHPDQLVSIIGQRTRLVVDSQTNSMISSFRVSKFQASRMCMGRILLAGDAAHVISPIGGQGMNLGWLDAYALFEVFSKNGRNASPSAFKPYSASRGRAYRRARHHSELNMWLGRGSSFNPLKTGLVHLMLSPLVQPFFAKQFTMRGLE
ncbi:FAD-dependent monooxygenase [bacterium]|nr:FAD-dependent monooxygenase [bacterium]